MPPPAARIIDQAYLGGPATVLADRETVGGQGFGALAGRLVDNLAVDQELHPDGLQVATATNEESDSVQLNGEGVRRKGPLWSVTLRLPCMVPVGRAILIP